MHSRAAATSNYRRDIIATQTATRLLPDLPTDLARVIDAWPTLPEPIRAGILAMVRAAAEDVGGR
jgi:hypothetical protein